MASARGVRLSPSVEKRKLKLELLRGSRLKLESLPSAWQFTSLWYARVECSLEQLRGEISRGYTSALGKIESVTTHSEVIEEFDSFPLLDLLFLVRNLHCWSRTVIPRQMTPREKRPFFHIADRHEELYGRSRLYASAQGRRETGGALSHFSSLSFDISMKSSEQRWSSDFQGLLRA